MLATQRGKRNVRTGIENVATQCCYKHSLWPYLSVRLHDELKFINLVKILSPSTFFHISSLGIPTWLMKCENLHKTCCIITLFYEVASTAEVM
jgi:hypothetical protein